MLHQELDTAQLLGTKEMRMFKKEKYVFIKMQLIQPLQIFI
jgi:hypothetical protein